MIANKVRECLAKDEAKAKELYGEGE